MKTIEDILQGVTPPETWHVFKDHGNKYAIMPDKDAYVPLAEHLSRRDAVLILRAARNFAPLVRALNKCDLAFVNWQVGQIPGRPEDILSLINEVRKSLAQALADEP